MSSLVVKRSMVILVSVLGLSSLTTALEPESTVTAKGLIAFIQLDEQGQWDIWTIDDNGENQQRLLATPDDQERFPSWSPDGHKLVCATSRGSLKIVTWPEGAEELLTLSTPRCAEPAWSPDGKKIAYIDYPPVPNRRSTLWYCWYDGSAWISEWLHTASSQKGFPAWSPDGTKLAIAVLNDIKESGPEEDIGILDLQGKDLKIIVREKDSLYPAFAPDGKRIAFASNRVGNYDLWLWEEGMPKLLQVTSNPAYDGDPTWAPDGKTIVFVSSRTGHKELWKVSLETLEETQLTHNNRESRDPVYRPIPAK